MGFLRRFRESPEDRARREAEDQARREAAARQAAEVRAFAEEQRQSAELQRQAAAAADADARFRAILGPDLAGMNVETPAEAKIAIKLARLRKKELQAEKRQLSAQLADVREEWRERTAGRVSTVGFGRGTTGRMIRAGVQGKRRAERQQHAGNVNAFSNAKQAIDAQIDVIDRVIIELERKALGATNK